MQVSAALNCFDPGQRVTAEVPEGQSVLQILGGDWSGLRVMVGAEEIPRAIWPYTRPKPGQVVRIYAMPQNDSGIWRAVAAVAVAVASAYTAGAVGAVYGAGWGAAAGAGVAIAGQLAVNALIPPQALHTGSDLSTGDRGNTITGAQNRAARYGVIPRTYGRIRWFPPLAANYYTEPAGEDQYLRMLVCLGYGPLEIGGQIVGAGYAKVTAVPPGTMAIGETDIGEYDDVEYEIGVRDQITLYSRDIQEISPQVVFETEAPEGDNEWFVDGIEAVRTTEPDVDEISVDILWPRGLIARTERDEYTHRVEYSIDYAPTGSDTWTQVVYREVARKTADAFRTTNRFTVPRGQYDVRVTRERTFRGTNGDPDLSQSQMSWSALRSIRNETPFDQPDCVLLALRIRATDQLEGVVDQLRVWQTAVLPVWDGVEYTLQPTRNPAWAYLDAMRGVQVRRPIADSRIDFEAIREWAAWCDAEGWTYDFSHDTDETLPQRLQRIAAAGLASYTPNIAGKIGVVREVDSEPVALITPRNSWGFRATKAFATVPHALKIRYISGDSWQQDTRIVYDDGFDESNATRFESLDVEGLTNPDLVWRYGRRHLAQMKLRPETYTVSMDFENVRFRRGDTVLLAHDVMLVGIGTGRIRAIDGNIVRVDQDIPLEAGKSYAARVQVTDTGALELRAVITGAGLHTDLELESATGLAVGDLITFGEVGRETLECRVAEIRYAPDLEAEITLVDAASAILEADQGAIPEYDPTITRAVPIEQLRPEHPVIDVARSDQSTLQIASDGTFQPGVLIGWQMRSGRLPVDLIELRYRTNDQWSTVQRGPADRRAILTALPAGATAYVKMRARSIYGTWSRWSSSTLVTVEAANARPTDITGFDLVAQGDTAILSWDRAPDVDVRIGGRVLLYHGSQADISTAVPLDRLPGGATTGSVPLLPGYYLAVFEDSGGRQSETPAVIFTTAPQATKYNAVEVYEEPPTAGTVISGLTVTPDDYLELTDDEGVYETGTVVDLGQVYAARVWAQITTSTYLVSDLISNRGQISTWESISGTGQIKGPGARVYIRTTEDDPAGTPVWSDWKRLNVGVYRARAYQVRIVLTRENADQGIRLQHWQLNVDMPDRTESDDNVAVAAGGTRISFAPPFRATPKVGITIEDAQPGDRYRRTNTDRTGFDVEVLDSAGASVARTIDWYATGYGYEEA